MVEEQGLHRVVQEQKSQCSATRKTQMPNSKTRVPHPVSGDGWKVEQGTGASDWIPVSALAGVDVDVVAGSAVVEQTSATWDVCSAGLAKGRAWVKGLVSAGVYESDNVYAASAVRLVVTGPGAQATMYTRS
jgi:hypothetical protein